MRARPGGGSEREQELFHACVELTATDREAYLETACAGDPGLRERVLRLVDADRRARDHTLSPLAALPPLAELPDVVGPYRLLGVLGEGGMAVVYEAEQLEPIRRRVALKVVKLGMDTRQVVARFRAEQQALAAMDHPDVAKVFDAGQTVSGRPYFVMERVHGAPLREYCAGHPLSVAEKAALVARVCHAVQHAHQKGVIHRDLKPSNILVAESDAGVPVPKIIDFGIAKAVGLEGPGATEFTRGDQALGTPAYMSPEQAGRSGLDVDTRTDVYSLGVVLYELLAGSLPAEPSEAGYAEFLARLAKGDLHPPRPSVRAGGSRALAGDLDAIVMKALEVDRSRRYETPQALADDLERYARKETVSARPPTLSYRARRFVARNRFPVAAAAVTGLAILAGAGAALWQAQAAIAERDRAEEVKEFITSIFREADPHEGSGTALSATDLLKQAKARIDRSFVDRPELRVELLSLVGATLSSLQDHAAADAVVSQAVEEGTRALGADHPRTLHARVLLTTAHRYLGRQARMREDLAGLLPLLRGHGPASEDLLLALENVAHVAIDDGRHDDAEAAAREAVDVAARVRGPRDPRTVALSRLLALAYHFNKKSDLALQTAEPAYRLTLEVRQNNTRHPDVIDARAMYGRMLADVGRLDEAIEHTGQAVGDARALFGPSSTMVGFFSGRLSQYQQAKGELHLALESAREHLSILGRLAKPDSFTHLSARSRYATALLAARRGEQALAELDTVAGGFRRARGPESDWVSGTDMSRALALAYVGRVKEARAEAARVLEELRARPGAALGRALYVAGVAQRLDGDPRAALRSQEEALQAIEPGPRADRERMPVLAEIGLVHVALGNHDQGVRVLAEALALFETLERRTTPPHADALVALGRARLAQGRPADAVATLAKADLFWREFAPGSRWAREAALWLGRASRRPRMADGRAER